MRFKLLALCAMIACSASAAAQTGEDPRACVRDGAPSQDYEQDGAKEWPHEAQRFKSNEQMVSRRHDRLRRCAVRRDSDAKQLRRLGPSAARGGAQCCLPRQRRH